MRNVSKIKWDKFNTFIFDLDGTVWKWNRVIPGAKKTIEQLQRKKQVLFITNNTILSQQKLIKKLWKFGIHANRSQLINPGIVAAKYFKQKVRRKECVLAIGNGLREDLRAAKIKTTNRAIAKYVIVGHDLRFDYMKLFTAVEALRRGAKLYATALGRYFIAGNDFWPGTGVLVKAIEYASGKKAKLLGKPSLSMLKAIKAVNKSKPKKTVLIGDELNSDVATGKKLGYFTVLVRTGVDRAAKKIKPDAIVKSIASIKPINA